MNQYDKLAVSVTFLEEIKDEVRQLMSEDDVLTVKDKIEAALVGIRGAMEAMGNFDQAFSPREAPVTMVRLSGTQLLLASMVPPDTDVAQWAGFYDQTRGQTTEVMQASWMLYYGLGIEPDGSRPRWNARMITLLQAAGTVDNLAQGIRDANKARMENGITIKGPESVMAFALNVKQQKLTDELSGGSSNVVVV